MIETLLLLSLIVFVTHGLEAVTGFGCTVLAFPFVIAVTGDIVFSKIILTILAWVLALFLSSLISRRSIGASSFLSRHWQE